MERPLNSVAMSSESKRDDEPVKYIVTFSVSTILRAASSHPGTS